jgi:adenylate cyclase class IV
VAQEHEIKINLKVPLERLIERAEATGFIKAGEIEQVDTYYDTGDWGLYNEVAALRTRSVDGRMKSFTYKKLYYMPKKAKPWFVEELETEFPVKGKAGQEIFRRLGMNWLGRPLSFRELAATLKRAGYQDEQIMPKQRLVYTKDDMELVIDDIGGVGVIVELESPTQDATDIIDGLIGKDSWERSLEGTGYLWLEKHKGFKLHKDYDRRLKDKPEWNVTDVDREWYQLQNVA